MLQAAGGSGAKQCVVQRLAVLGAVEQQRWRASERTCLRASAARAGEESSTKCISTNILIQMQPKKGVAVYRRQCCTMLLVKPQRKVGEQWLAQQLSTSTS